MRSASPSPARAGPEPTWARVASMSGSPSCGQALAGRAAGGDGGQALLGVAAVLLEVQRDQRLDGGALRRRRGRRGRPGGRPAAGPCRGSRPGRRRRAGPGRSGRSAARADPKRRWRSAAAVMGKLRATASSPARPATAGHRSPGTGASIAPRAFSHEHAGRAYPPIRPRQPSNLAGCFSQCVRPTSEPMGATGLYF